MTPIRLGGLASNMDTDSIVVNMMKAQRMKQDKLKANKTKLGWQQDQWKELQTKLYKLYTDFASPLRMSDAYNTKKVTSSNGDKVNVTLPPGSTNVPEGTHTVTVDEIASAQFLSGGKLTVDKNGAKITSSTKLMDLAGMEEGAVFTIKNKGKEINFQVRADSTIEEYVNELKKGGLVANFDAGLGRLLISSKESGTENSFTISSSQMTAAQITAKNDLDSYLQYKNLGASDRAALDNAYLTLRKESLAAPDDKQAARDTLQAIAKKNAETKQLADAKKYVKEEYIKEVKSGGLHDDIYQKAKKEVDDMANGTWTPADYDAAMKKRIESYADQYLQSTNGKADVDYQYGDLSGVNGGIQTVLGIAKNDTANKIGNFELAAGSSPGSSAQRSLQALGLDHISDPTIDIPADPSNPSKLVIVASKDSEITYNGLKMTGSSNLFTVNGITIEAKDKTAGTGPVSINVTNDTQAVYDKIKKFIGSYNEVLKEMNDLYYAPSSKGYDPLTDEEQAAMTDKQIEKWEGKIKDSILRRDDNLATLTNGIKTAMMSSIEIDGKRYSLSSFGITTSDMDYSEKGLLHIWGDKDDSTYAGKPDKLMEALNTDPELVMKAFSGIAGNLYKDMFDKMKGTELRTALKFYNDKSISNKMRKYDKDIAAWDKKLATMESKYYKQFSDMEVALSKLNSQQSALAGMLG